LYISYFAKLYVFSFAFIYFLEASINTLLFLAWIKALCLSITFGIAIRWLSNFDKKMLQSLLLIMYSLLIFERQSSEMLVVGKHFLLAI